MPGSCARELIGAVRNHLVRVHVAVGAGPGLEHAERELVVQPAGDHFVGGLSNQVGDGRVDRAQGRVGRGGGLLDQAEGANDAARPPIDGRVADREVGSRPLGHGSPEPRQRDGHRPERIVLEPGVLIGLGLAPHLTDPAARSPGSGAGPSSRRPRCRLCRCPDRWSAAEKDPADDRSRRAAAWAGRAGMAGQRSWPLRPRCPARGRRG